MRLFHAGNDNENAGSGRLTIVVPKMDKSRKSLAEIGVKVIDESEGDYGRIAPFADPDGNRITLAEPHSRAFNKQGTWPTCAGILQPRTSPNQRPETSWIFRLRQV